MNETNIPNIAVAIEGVTACEAEADKMSGNIKANRREYNTCKIAAYGHLIAWAAIQPRRPSASSIKNALVQAGVKKPTAKRYGDNTAKALTSRALKDAGLAEAANEGAQAVAEMLAKLELTSENALKKLLFPPSDKSKVEGIAKRLAGLEADEWEAVLARAREIAAERAKAAAEAAADKKRSETAKATTRAARAAQKEANA